MPIDKSKLPDDPETNIFDWMATPVVDMLPSGVKTSLENMAHPGLNTSPTAARIKGFLTGAAEAVTPNWIASIPAQFASGGLGVLANTATGAEGAYQAYKGYEKGNKAQMAGGALNAIGSLLGATHAALGMRTPEGPGGGGGPKTPPPIPANPVVAAEDGTKILAVPTKEQIKGLPVEQQRPISKIASSRPMNALSSAQQSAAISDETKAIEKGVAPILKKATKNQVKGLDQAIADTRPSSTSSTGVASPITTVATDQAGTDLDALGNPKLGRFAVANPEAADLGGAKVTRATGLPEPPSEATQRALSAPANRRMATTQLSQERSAAKALSNAETRADAADLAAQQRATTGIQRDIESNLKKATPKQEDLIKKWSQTAKNENARQSFLENQAAQAEIEAQKAGLEQKPTIVTERQTATGPEGVRATATKTFAPEAPEGGEAGPTEPPKIPVRDFEYNAVGKPTFVPGNKTQALKLARQHGASMIEPNNGGYNLYYEGKGGAMPPTPKPPKVPKGVPAEQLGDLGLAPAAAPPAEPTVPPVPAVAPILGTGKGAKLAETEQGADELDALQRAMSGGKEPPTKGNGTIPVKAKAPKAAAPKAPAEPVIAPKENVPDLDEAMERQGITAGVQHGGGVVQSPAKGVLLTGLSNKAPGKLKWEEAPVGPETPAPPPLKAQLEASLKAVKEQPPKAAPKATYIPQRSAQSIIDEQVQQAVTKASNGDLSLIQKASPELKEAIRARYKAAPAGTIPKEVETALDVEQAPKAAAPIAAQPPRPEEPTTTPHTDTLGQTSKAREAALAKRQAAKTEALAKAKELVTPPATGDVDAANAADLEALSKMSPAERKSFLDRLKSQGGQANLGLTSRLAGGMIGGAAGGTAGYKTDPLHNKTLSALAGAAIGAGGLAALPEIIGGIQKLEPLTADTSKSQELLQKATTLRNSGMLGPLSVAKKALGDIGGLGAAAVQNQGRAGAIMNELLHGRDITNDFKTGFNFENPAEISAFENTVKNVHNPLSWSGRTMSGLTNATKGVLNRAGFTPEEAELYTFTNQPTTELGKDILSGINRNKILQHVAPFAKIGINRAERGLENSPLGALALFSETDPAARSKILKDALVGSTIAGGAYAATPENFLKKHPTVGSLIGALAGPYGLPVMGAMAAKGSHTPLSAAMKEDTRDLPGFRFIEDIQSPEAFLRNYLSGYTNLGRPITELIRKATGEREAETKSKRLNWLEREGNQAISNIPVVESLLPRKGTK